MLYSQRKQQAELADRENAGESFWTEAFGKATREKLAFAFFDICGAKAELYSQRIRDQLVRAFGVPKLAVASNRADELRSFVRTASDGQIPDFIESAIGQFEDEALMEKTGNRIAGTLFRHQVNRILREARIAYELVGPEIVPFSSRELHVEVVEPMLRLVSGDARFANVEVAYQKALQEIANNEPGDAITDVGTALQETLQLLGCDGNALGPLIKSARVKGLIAAHDVKLLDWISAERSEAGDSHSVSDATLADAWLVVHVVGATILHLARGTDWQVQHG